MPPVVRVLETSLYVEDLERSAEFYERVLGFTRLEIDSDRLVGLSVADQQMLLLFKKGASRQPSQVPGGLIPPTDGDGNLHLTFAIPAGTLEEWERHLGTQGVAIESRVHWEAGGESLYFRDPDAHVLELATPGIWPIY